MIRNGRTINVHVHELVLVLVLVLLGSSLGACDSTSGKEQDAAADLQTDLEVTPDAADRDAADTLVVPQCSVTHLYDPLNAPDLELFPDDLLTKPADSPTGLVLDIQLEKAPWLANVPDLFAGDFDELDYITGFGLNGGIFMRFSGNLAPLPSVEESVVSDAIMLLDLSQDPPARLPYDAHFNEAQRAFIVTPMLPMREGALHALVVTDVLTAEDGGCIDRSAVTDALLQGDAPDARLEGLRERYASLLATGVVEAEHVVALSTFTTHRDLDLMRDIAADIETRTYTWGETLDCVDHGAYRKCESSFVAWDYRDNGVVRSVQTAGSWTLPIAIWLPAAGQAPYPTVVIGHGMDQDRHIGDLIIDRLAPLGVAMIAIDSLQHGEHPTADADDTNDPMQFLGLELSGNIHINGKVLRANLAQTILDRVQLMELLEQGQDIDGDGAPDLDSGKLLYIGPSLGGMVGSGVLALRNDFEALIFSVSGGNLTHFIIENALIAAIKPLIGSLAGSEARFDRFVTALQVVLDGADPASFGAHILYDRFDPASAPPHTLFNVAMKDILVPPSAGRAMARAMQIPHVGPVIDPLHYVPRDDTTLPLSGNLLDGALTAGFFQFDRVTDGVDVEEAGHQTVTLSPEGLEQEFHFIGTWADGQLPEIIDPYVVLGTPALP